MATQTQNLRKKTARQGVAVASTPVAASSPSVLQASLRTRPFWFNGRFLSARDMERDQNYFLTRQSVLGRAAGFGVIHGLMVEAATDNETFVIRAGQGITPGGQLVMLSADITVNVSDLADEENLDEQFGLAETPAPVARTRTGLYVVALRPVEFTANPITSYPTSLQGSPTTHDGSVIEATAISLIPFAAPSSNYDTTSQNAAVARQIFIEGATPGASPSLLPLAIVSLDRDAIQWVDSYLVRRDSGPEFSGLSFGLADSATQQAFLLQYDGQLQLAVNAVTAQKQPAPFAATDYFQALPPAGRLPLASINVNALTQLYFPQQTDVTLSLIPHDELPAWLEDSLALPPIDLTLTANTYADLSVFILVPVPRAKYTSLAAQLPPVSLTAAVPQALSYRNPVSILRFFNGPVLPVVAAASGWSGAIGTRTYGYYVRRRSTPIYVTPVNTTTATTLASSGTDIAGVTLTATVLPSAATGQVTFSDGQKVIGTATLASGVATLSPSPFTQGTRSLVASYPGDGNYTGSVSLPLSLTVTES